MLLALMLFVEAIASSWAGYEWSPQVIQLNVPVAAAAALGEAAPLDAAAVAAAVAALDAAGAELLAAVEHAAAMLPRPTAPAAAPITLRKCRRL